MKLPTSWQMKRLEKLVQFSSGGTPSKAKPEFWQGDIPWISAATMHQQEIELLKQLADKYKNQKRGLMQKMLTGEWRMRGFSTNDEG